jgi:small subunit ribosomal protein S3e
LGAVCTVLQFVADGVFYAELNELLTRELAADGYSGVEVRVTPMRTEIIIRATRTQNVLGKLQEAVRVAKLDSLGALGARWEGCTLVISGLRISHAPGLAADT